MKKYPQEPEQWEDPKLTLYRRFKLRSAPDIECLMRLVNENLYDGGNSRYLRARLLGILQSQWNDANRRFWIQHKHPKTWYIRYRFQTLKRWYYRTFNTKEFRGEVMMCNLAREVIKEEKNK